MAMNVLSFLTLVVVTFSACGLQQLHHVNVRDAVVVANGKNSDTKLAFIQDGVYQVLHVPERIVGTDDNTYFDPITGESLDWDDPHGRHGPTPRTVNTRTKQSRIPLQKMMMAIKSTPTKLENENNYYYFDPTAGEPQCWFM